MNRNDTVSPAPAVAAKAQDTDWLGDTIDPTSKPAGQPSQPTSALIGVYDGRQYIGHLRRRDPEGVEAYDINTFSVGLYDTLDAAARGAVALCA
jgi:hypothetical protein